MRRLDPDVRGTGSPAHERFVEPQRRPSPARAIQRTRDTAIGGEHQSIRLEQPDLVSTRSERGKPLADLFRRQHATGLGSRGKTFGQRPHGLAIRVADHERGGAARERLGGPAGEVLPRGSRRAQERLVLRTLVGDLPEETRLAAGGSEPVRRRESVETEDGVSPRGKLRGGVAPYAAQTDDREVERDDPPLRSSGCLREEP